MKILNVNMSLDPINGGGTAERTVQMSRFLATDAQGCTILTLDLGLSRKRIDSLAGVEVIALPCLLERFYLPRFSSSAIQEIVGNSDIIHLMGHWTFLNALVYWCARRQKKPYVVCPAGALPIFGRSRVLKHVYNALVGYDVVRGADRCIAITQLETEHFSSYGVMPERISVIPNGVDVASVPAQANDALDQLGLPKRPFLLFLGRLNPIKGPDILLDAYAQLRNPPYDLVFAGPDGGLLKPLQAQSVEYGLSDRVHFPGALRGDDKYQAYYAASALIIPSRKEAMSIVALEAGATGTPVLLTNECGFDEAEKCGGGFIVPPTVDGLKNGLENLIRREAELDKMGAALKKLVIEHYSWESIAKIYGRMYNEILIQHSRN
jgi:glycosyltransferase involved in cell wall biosynthesis